MATKEAKSAGGWLEGRTKFILQYALETWYEPLKEYTPRTMFVTLSRPQQAALYALCLQQPKESPEAPTDEDYGARLAATMACLAPEQRELVEEVVAEVGRAIAEFGGEAFVKLSTRSPKDAVTGCVNKRMEAHLTREMERSDGTPNGDSVAFVTASRHAFRVTSGEEAVDLLAQSSRVMEDLMKFLDLPEDLGLPFNVIVREWSDMRPEMEFRVFVKNKQITAISQYCYYQYFPDLPAARENIRRQIFELWARIAHLVPQDHCVVDFVLLNGEPVIIELNPFFGDTGACLFTWRDPDRYYIPHTHTHHCATAHAHDTHQYVNV